ncbi:MAG: ATP-binding cassette domain-containing protein [Luteitalea sp.]|nr:ATP-binding cassette domain-containing protein [Luteitalea sp.]
MDAAILLKGVTKTFGSTEAVRDLDLLVPRGGLYGFIGPNGAGKTTSIRMIMSIIFPNTGTLSVLGRPSALDAKDRIGYLPEERGVYRKMRVGAFLTYMGRLKGVSDAHLRAHIGPSLERVGLPGIERKRCEELSKGMLQKVQFLVAIIHEPDLLILDEPFSGLDPVSTRLVRDLILEEHRRGATVLLSTHVMPHAEELCQHVVMIHRGRKVLDEPLASIRRRYDPRTIRFEPLDPESDPSPLQALSEVERVDRVDGSYEIALIEGADPGAAIRRVTAAIAPARIELSRPRLEEVFIRIVADETTSAEAEHQMKADLRDLAAPGGL